MSTNHTQDWIAKTDKQVLSDKQTDLSSILALNGVEDDVLLVQ